MTTAYAGTLLLYAWTARRHTTPARCGSKELTGLERANGTRKCYRISKELLGLSQELC